MDILKEAIKTFSIEISELIKIRDRISEEFVKACDLIMNSKGKVVVTGIGKSGIIANKIASTLSSTGTLAVFMNSGEALHGDLGMIREEDILLAISNSGNSDELLSIMPSIKEIGAKIISMTGNKNSKLAVESDCVLDIKVDKEACPMDLAPTSSTTATLVMGDAIAVSIMKMKKFKPENFALFHPGGAIGKRLLMKVGDIMHPYEKLAIVKENTPIEKIILEMTNKNLGAVCVFGEKNKMIGFITEGDIRRALKNKDKFFNFSAKDIMTKSFVFVKKENLAVKALELMENRKNQIDVLPVFEGDKLVGIVRVHDLINFFL